MKLLKTSVTTTANIRNTTSTAKRIGNGCLKSTATTARRRDFGEVPAMDVHRVGRQRRAADRGRLFHHRRRYSEDQKDRPEDGRGADGRTGDAAARTEDGRVRTDNPSGASRHLPLHKGGLRVTAAGRGRPALRKEFVMVNIKKQGKQLWYRFECDDCGCEFEATVPDAFIVCSVQGPVMFCECPCCGQECQEDHDDN